ncbi:MAG TPA: ANTAR domain-containing protein [Stellaceae bacterium]|nr:ANTAR domain-containing protein [Stellaceae bacterium]
MTMRIPNFRNKRALLLHRHDRNLDAVVEQLEKLGVYVTVRWPAEGVSASDTDVVFFDSDLAFDGLFAWMPGAAPAPLIAMLGSEAPGRIEWTLAQQQSAYLLKPIGSTGVFTALSIAFHHFALRRAQEEELCRLEAGLERRADVIQATVTLMRRYEVSPETAFRMLRAESMRRRATLGAVSSLILDGKWLPSPREAQKQMPGKRRTSG